MKSLDAIMSLKIRFLHPQLGFFPFNCGDVSNEHGEKFLQDIAVMEKRYQGKCSSALVADFCWQFQREDSNASYRRKSR